MFDFLSHQAFAIVVVALYFLVAVALVFADSFFKWHHRPVERFMNVADNVIRYWPVLLLLGLVQGLVQIGTWARCWCGIQRPASVG